MELAREFGSVIADLGYATIEQVREARREVRRLQRTERRRVFLSELLIARGLIDTARLATALERARGYREQSDDPSPRLGEVAIGKGYASPLQVYESLIEQRDEVASGVQRRLLGDIMVDRCRVTPWELEDVLITAAELAAGSLRSGNTPHGGFYVADAFGDDTARSFRRDVVATTKRTTVRPCPAAVSDLLGPFVRTSPDALVRTALEGAIEADAEAILVFDQGELVGSLSVWDAYHLDSEILVGKAMGRVDAALEARSTLADAARLLERTEMTFLPVVSEGRVAGVLTAGALREAGVSLARADVELGGSD
jgi:CBS domain-containing protein